MWWLFVYLESNQFIVKGSPLRQSAISVFLGGAINLEPLNIFLYTWRFLGALEREEQNERLKKAYRLFALITGWAVPIIYYCLFAALVVVG